MMQKKKRDTMYENTAQTFYRKIINEKRNVCKRQLSDTAATKCGTARSPDVQLTRDSCEYLEHHHLCLLRSPEDSINALTAVGRTMCARLHHNAVAAIAHLARQRDLFHLSHRQPA